MDAMNYPMSWFELLYPYTRDRWEKSDWFYNGQDAHDGAVQGWKGKGIWNCPSLERVESAWPYQFGGYAYNGRGCGRGLDRRTLGLAGDLTRNTDGSPVSKPIRDSDVTTAAMMLAMGDVDAVVFKDHYPTASPTIVFEKGDLHPVSVLSWIELGIIPDQPDNRVLKRWQAAVSTRHAGRWQSVYCDAHVEKALSKDLFDVREREVRMRWNRDRDPHTEIILKVEPDTD
jgi:hypothetical protein